MVFTENLKIFVRENLKIGGTFLIFLKNVSTP
jgi:hypothetical protein